MGKISSAAESLKCRNRATAEARVLLDVGGPAARALVSRAKELGIRSVPAVVIDGKLASCCAGRGVDIEVLKAAGLGKAL